MKRARAHAAVADVSDRYDWLLLYARGEQHARHHRDHVAEMRDRTDESLGHIAEMNVEIASAGRPPGLCHVLREDVARANAFHEHGAKIANQRRDEILLFERVSSTH